MQKHILSCADYAGEEIKDIAKFLNDNNYVFMNDYFKTHNTRENVIKLGMDICSALDEYEQRGMSHGGVKPSNIFVSPAGDFVLGDENMAGLYEDSYPNINGVYVYMAPETLKEGKKDAKSDIYSLGIIMYKLLNNNRAPFRKSDDYEDAKMALDMRMSGKRLSAPVNADALFSEIILKACEYEPNKRYPSPSYMHERLNNLVLGKFVTESYEDNEVPVEDYTEYEEEIFVPVKRSRKKIIFISVIAVVLCALAGVGAYTINLANRYSEAEGYLRNERFDDAREVFNDISGYKDSQKMLLKCDYKEAHMLFENGETDKAIKLYEKLIKNGYEDSQEKLFECYIYKAEKLIEDGKSDEADKILKKLGSDGSSKAKELIHEYKYDMATKLFKEKKYEQAAEIFEQIDDDEMVNECNYKLAVEYMRNNKYTNAMEIFNELGDYNDSENQFETAERWLMGENETEEILISATSFAGRYSNEDGDYVEYTCDENGNIGTKYNLPYEEGRYFKLKNGVHYHGSDSTGWEKQWIFEPVNENELNVYNYIDGKLYTLTKK
jgi:tetratricopeptide (TPR) repeat protein